MTVGPTPIAPRRAAGGPSRSAFSLIELVIVLTIMGVIAAIALPRVTKSSDNAEQTALDANTALLNKSIALYATEHSGVYPDVANAATQLTMFTDYNGDNPSPAPNADTGAVYGPYLVKIPAVTLGPHKGDTGIAAADGPGIGWIYDRPNRRIEPNLTAPDPDDDPDPLDIPDLPDLPDLP